MHANAPERSCSLLQYFVRAGLHAAASELVNECEQKRIQLKIPTRNALKGVDVEEVKVGSGHKDIKVAGSNNS